MKSMRGATGSLVVLLAFPAAIILSIALGGPETLLHLILSAGFLIVATAVFDFRVRPALTWIGSAGIGILGAIFLLQGVSDVADVDAIHDLAYGLLGQLPERLAPDLFILWCFAVLLQDSAGKTRLFGLAVMSLIVVLELIDYAAQVAGSDAPDVLKLLYLLPFVWLLLESRKPTLRPQVGVAASV
jgi:hypothetical protein